MATQRLEEEGALDAVRRARALGDGALEVVQRAIHLAKAGEDVGEVIGGDVALTRALLESAQNLARAGPIARHGVGLAELREPDRARWGRRCGALELLDRVVAPAIHEVRPAERRARAVDRVELDGGLRAAHRFLDAAGAQEHRRGVAATREGI